MKASLLLCCMLWSCVPAGPTDESPDASPDESTRDAGNGAGLDAGLDAGPREAPDAGPITGTIDRLNWTRQASRAPINLWETNLAWDKSANVVVNHGGHVLGYYAQSSSTYRYSRERTEWTLSHAPTRPQRRCLVDLTWVDSMQRVLSGNGASDHGSLPQGGPSADGRSIIKSDPRGPWLYDSTHDVWEDTRMLDAEWARMPHRQLAYDPVHDAVVYLAGAKVGLYAPRTNTMVYRTLPPTLQGRRGYGIAADSRTGTIVVFGGASQTPFAGTPDAGAAYLDNVFDDTWLYDVGSDRWQDVSAQVRPPRGMPIVDFLKLNLAFHEATGQFLLFTVGTSTWVDSFSAWPAPQAWAFNPSSQAWSQVEQLGQRPVFPGIIAMDQAASEVMLLGGSRDGQPTNDPRPATSQTVYSGLVQGTRAQRSVVAPTTGTFSSTSTYELTWTGSGSWDVWKAPVQTVAGAFTKVATVSTPHYRDDSPPSPAAYRIVPSGQPWALGGPVIFSAPLRPSGLQASVESAHRVALRWHANAEPDLAGYLVMRAHADGSAQVSLTPSPINTTEFVDLTDDLSDGLLRKYWVVALNTGGLRSGPSPLAWSAPEAPLHVQVEVSPNRTVATLHWTWPAQVAVGGFKVYVNDHHENTLGYTQAQSDAWWAQWRLANASPVSATSLQVTLPDPSKDYVFYVRAVSTLGVEGFFTDIVSATNPRFLAP